MLNKKNRLKSNSSFKATYCQNRVVSDEFFVLFAGKNKNKEGETKAGFVVSKKIDKRAVVRNKIKRRMREAFQAYLKENNPPFMSYILTAKEKSKEADFRTILKSVYKLTEKMAKKFIQEYYREHNERID